MLRARSIKPFVRRRWRLRWTRATADPNLVAMGIESFFVCSLLILHDLVKTEKSENRS